MGMKMMGLQDGTYYLAWLIHFTILNLWCSGTQAYFIGGGCFTKVNGFLIFAFLFLTVAAMFGVALVIVAIAPSQKAAQGYALIYFFLTF